MIDALERMLAAHSVEAVWALHTAEMEKYGFDRLLYGFTRFRTKNSLGNRDDMLVLSNHSDEYIETFMGQEMYRTAPMVAWAIANTGVKSWLWLAESGIALTDDQKKVLEFNRRMGVRAGYTISFPENLRRDKGAIALTARPGLSQNDVEKIWEKDGREITVLNQVAHLKLSSLPFPKQHGRLSHRQREVLEWVGDGKTTQDIAVIMGLTPATVEKHLRKARDALLVETTAQAVMKASLQNQIFIVEP